MTTTTVAAMLDAARHALGAEPDERVRAQIERLAEHVDAVNAFPLTDETVPYFPSPHPLTNGAVSPAPPYVSSTKPAQAGQLHTLSAMEIARLVAARAVSVSEVAVAALERIAATEKSLQAWVYVDREAVLAQAKKLDAMQGAAWLRGPLHGVPVGVKDIYDVEGMPTRAGSRVLADALPATRDSWLVARLRAAGALIVGKTATTEFAYADPAGTRNPWNLAHTPGGSSSGSAAAVAARVVPLALGSQTAGSVIRPASFCGIVGFKPTWGRVRLDGVIPFAWSLDTAGWFARSVEDAALVWQAISGERLPRWNGQTSPKLLTLNYDFKTRLTSETREYEPQSVTIAGKARSGRPTFSERVEIDALFHESKSSIFPLGTPLAEYCVPRATSSLAAQQVLMASEASAYHYTRPWNTDVQYGRRIGALLAAGQTVSAKSYIRAQRIRATLRSLYLDALSVEQRDAIVTAATPGAAPEGLDSTGDPSFNAPWTQFGFPAITLFGGLDPQGLPLGVQLVGRPGADGELLGTAAWCENVLGAAPAPPDYAV
jgi:aspartyl-tRNA(Asn)/glutamyl-tRNA(Gln) amidotransferase subunit A